MITRDFLLREIETVVQVLGVVLGLRRDGHAAEAEARIAAAIAEASGVTDVSALDRDQTVALADHLGAFHPLKAVALADLLRESDRPGAGQQALWLYRAAMDSGEAVPFDLAARIASLPSGGDGAA